MASWGIKEGVASAMAATCAAATAAAAVLVAGLCAVGDFDLDRERERERLYRACVRGGVSESQHVREVRGKR